MFEFATVPASSKTRNGYYRLVRAKRNIPADRCISFTLTRRCSSGVEQLHGGPQSPAHAFREERMNPE
jgi:hypothetical protein